LTGSIVQAKKQEQPCGKPVKVEAAAPAGLPLLCWEWAMCFARWFGAWLWEPPSDVGLTSLVSGAAGWGWATQGRKALV